PSSPCSTAAGRWRSRRVIEVLALRIPRGTVPVNPLKTQIDAEVGIHSSLSKKNRAPASCRLWPFRGGDGSRGPTTGTKGAPRLHPGGAGSAGSQDPSAQDGARVG